VQTRPAPFSGLNISPSPERSSTKFGFFLPILGAAFLHPANALHGKRISGQKGNLFP
jgi:hypothetical protein